MRRSTWNALSILVILGVLGTSVSAQGSLSQQVLQLLSRVNSWIGTNTFYDLRIPCTTIPGDTTARVYADGSCNLYYDGGLIAGSGGGVTPHNLLSTTHPDTLTATPTAGAVVVANSTPVWASLPGATGYLKSTGSATTFSTDGAAFTSLPAAVLTGTLPAISGVNLTALNASNLGSGTVPLARLSGITNAQIDAAAAIAYSKLALTGSILNADINASAAIVYSKLVLTNSIVAGDLTAASVTMAKIAQAGATSGQVIAWSGSAWVPTSPATSGTVTSVGLSLPAIFTVAGSPVTTSGTLSATLATQTQNLVWASPNGSTGAPTFRAFLNADLPLSGVAAGTYPSVTVNTRGIVTAASTTIALTSAVSGTLPAANGGLGITTVTDDTTLVASGTAWVATTLPDCTRLWSYSQTTNLFSCGTTAAFGTLTASTPLSITQSWNSGIVVFNGFDISITDSASVVTSTIANWSVGGSSKFAVRKDGALLIGATRVYSPSTPTISAGFGTSPSIAGRDSALRVTQGNPVGATGTVTFGTAFTNAPICTGVDETTTAGNPLKLTATTTTVAVASGGTMVAADLLAISCIGY
jgi:hypothetical protein